VTIAGYSGSTSGTLNGAFICTLRFLLDRSPFQVGALFDAAERNRLYWYRPIPDRLHLDRAVQQSVTFQASGLDKGILMDEFYNGFQSISSNKPCIAGNPPHVIISSE